MPWLIFGVILVICLVGGIIIGFSAFLTSLGISPVFYLVAFIILAPVAILAGFIFKNRRE